MTGLLPDPALPSRFSLASQTYELTHGGLINNEKLFYDVEILHEKAKYFAHTYILKYRCPKLLNKSFKKWIKKYKAKKAGKKGSIATVEISMTAFSRGKGPFIIKRILEYIYRDSVNFDKVSNAHVLLLRVAASELELTRLEWLCEMKLRENLDLTTVFPMLKEATDLKQARIRNICLEFCFANYSDFIGNTSGTKVLGLELFQEVIRMYTDNQKIEAPILPEPTSTLKDTFKQIFTEMKDPDLTIQVGTEPIHCHRAIVAAFSPSLNSRIVSASGASRKPPVLVELNHLKSVEAAKAFLRFVYFGDVSIHPLAACDMVSFDISFHLKSLQTVVEQIIQTSVTKETVLQIMGVTYMPDMAKKPDMETLRLRCSNYMLENFNAIDLTPLYQMSKHCCLDLINAMQRAKGWDSSKAVIAEVKAPSPPVSNVSMSSAFGLGSDSPSSPRGNKKLKKTKSKGTKRSKTPRARRDKSKKSLGKISSEMSTPTKTPVKSISVSSDSKDSEETKGTPKASPRPSAELQKPPSLDAPPSLSAPPSLELKPVSAVVESDVEGSTAFTPSLEE